MISITNFTSNNTTAQVRNSNVGRIFKIETDNFPNFQEATIPDPLPPELDVSKTSKSVANDNEYRAFVKSVFQSTFFIGVPKYNDTPVGGSTQIPLTFAFYDYNNDEYFNENHNLLVQITTVDVFVSSYSFLLARTSFINGSQTVLAFTSA